MSVVLLVPVNPKRLKVVSTDTSVSVLFVVLRREQIILLLFLRQQLNFDILNVAVIYEGESNENLKYFFKYNLLCRSGTKLYHFST
jgi:hypothetical protein